MAKRPTTTPSAEAPSTETEAPRPPRKSGRPTSPKPPRPRAKKAAEAAAALASAPRIPAKAKVQASKTAAKPKAQNTKPTPPQSADWTPDGVHPRAGLRPDPGAEVSGDRETNSAPVETNPFAFPGADQRQMLESLSLNLARAAMTAQSAIAEAALSQADRPAALSPDPFNVGPAMNSVMTSLANRPDKLFAAQADLFNRYMDLWASTTRRAAGEEPPQPSKDKRFKDAAWSENPMFDMMRQSYLVTSDWMNGLVSSVEDVDPIVKRRAEFFTKLLTDAFSPSNFLASNPVALKAMAETNGESLVKGMQNFAADLERGMGKLKISQADYGQFVVGENVATAPGQVVWRDELFELIQFDAATDNQRAIPLLIFPPWINKFYIMDLQPENSMIRWLSAQGFTVFVCSWVNPDLDKAAFGFDEYLEKGIYLATQKVMDQTGQDNLNTVGYCIGGTLMGAALAHMAAKGDKRVNATTFFAAQHDFAEAGDLLLFTDEHWLAQVEQQMDAAGGVLPGAAMAETFNALRANDLIWSFFVSNYLMGKSPAAFDLLFWNADQTRMPKALHMNYLRSMYGQNLLSKGEFEIGGMKVDLSKVKIPLYFQASREDHIAPMNSVYRSARAFINAAVTLTLAGSGHIAGVINPPAANKYQHWINDALPATLGEWQAAAVEHPGSWWTHWAAWLHEKSGDWVTARDPKTGPLAPIEPAPGSYVKVKS